jgi:phosphatidylserine decarboxylase
MEGSLTDADFRLKQHHIPIAREGLPYILASAFATLVTAQLGYDLLAFPLLMITLLILHFFRDPIRWSNAGVNDVVSPADGRVIVVEDSVEDIFTGSRCRKISIFMSVFNVHVNRVPVSGTVKGIHYRKGSYRPAQQEKAGRDNEQNRLWIERDDGRTVVLTQVAGLIARRIVCWPALGDAVLRGERFGMIRFGSRLDVYVPGDCEVLVGKGEQVFAGESVLCRLK